MSAKTLFHGSMCALVTPFKNGVVDEKALGELVEWHIAEGTDGLIPVGTTGESPTLNHEEHHRVVRITIEAAGGRVPILAGAGSNSTAEAVELAQRGAADGADGLLIVTPYYNKPNQEGLKAHFTAVANAVDKPIILYDVPGRSVVRIDVDTMAELSQHANIAGVKDATGDICRVFDIRQSCGPDFMQLTGEDAMVLPYMSLGGHGCISVTANVTPGLCAQFHDAWAAGDLAEAQRLNEALMPLHAAMFSDTSPQPAKYALAKLGKMSDEIRLPLIGASTKAKAKTDAALVSLGLSN